MLTALTISSLKLLLAGGTVLTQAGGPQVKVEEGVLQGGIDTATGVRKFLGVPFAAPPVGELRWKAPQPAKHWHGVRSAETFQSRPMQLPLFGDMIFRSPGISEDCLYLNVWAPAGQTYRHLPVLVYFYGGGFVAGDSSEVRYDGARIAEQGIIAVTVNYRLGIFGGLAHPELTKESSHHASGNYGLLDQSAAIHWVKKNIAAFGGDPNRITIAGESAGSFSVCAQMASPLSRTQIAGAIGESGAFFGESLKLSSLAEGESRGVAFATAMKATNIADLRAIPAETLLEATKDNVYRFGAVLDNYFFTASPTETWAKGEAAHVPLLAGWNEQESGPGGVLGKASATPESFASAVQRLYPRAADELLKVYPATTDAEALQSARELASDRFIGYGTWKWTDLQAKYSHKPVYRYYYAHPRPGEDGANHSAEIEYALGNLSLNPHYNWTDDDHQVSATLMAYFVNFIKTGNPNGPSLPAWMPLAADGSGEVMTINVKTSASVDGRGARYQVLDSLASR